MEHAQRDLESRDINVMPGLRDSTTLQAIFRKGWIGGQILGGQRLLILQATAKFGKPENVTLASIEAIRDFEQLCIACVRMLDDDVRDWSNLLPTM